MQIRFKLVFLTFLLANAISKITLERGLQSTEITLTDIHSFSEVLVQAQFNYVDSDKYEKVHLAVRSSNKHKKQAYINLMKKYNSVVRTLIKLKAIPNKQSMIQSIVHRNFLRKSRKWEFSRYFILYALKTQINRITKALQIFRPQTVRTAPIVHYLDEKFMSIAAFLEAKIQLQNFIKKHLNSQYKILLTKDIQIVGDKFDNEQIIQNHIEQQFNNKIGELKQSASNLQSEAGEQHYYVATKDGRKFAKKIAMKVLFQIAEKSADVEDIMQQIQQGDVQSHSISDFEDQMINQQWKKIEKQTQEDQSTQKKQQQLSNQELDDL